MEEKDEKIVSIPFVAHEASMNRMERANKRISIIAICELIVILIMFIGIMVYFYMPTEVTEASEQKVTDIEDSEVNQTIGE